MELVQVSSYPIIVWTLSHCSLEPTEFDLESSLSEMTVSADLIGRQDQALPVSPWHECPVRAGLKRALDILGRGSQMDPGPASLETHMMCT